MHTSAFYSLVCLALCFFLVKSDENDLPLYIRITDIYASSCYSYAGYRNKEYLVIDKNKIFVSDLDNPGSNVPYIKLPGRYFLEFRDVAVQGKDLDYLVGDITIDLRVPLFGTEANIHAVPQELNNGVNRDSLNAWNCSRNGQVVSIERGKFACRYCDICTQSAALEDELERHKLIQFQGEKFSNRCQKFNSGQTYDMIRSITLQSPVRMQNIVDGDLTRQLQEAFAKGEGRIVAYLRLFSKPRSMTRDDYCKPVCSQEGNDARCWWCKQEYAAKARQGVVTDLSSNDNCISEHGQTELAACYNIEFRYNASDGLPNQVSQQRTSTTRRPSPTSFITGSFSTLRNNSVDPNSGADPCSKEISDRRGWCRGCWWCGEEYCSTPCRCDGRSSCR